MAAGRTPLLYVVCFLLGNSPASEFYMPTFRNTLFHLHSPMKMEHSAPKRRHIKLSRQGITQKKAYNIQNTAKVWNLEYVKQMQETWIPNAYHLPIHIVNFLHNVHKYTTLPTCNIGFTRNNYRRYRDGQITSKYGVKEMSLPHSGRQTILYNPQSLYEWNCPQKSGGTSHSGKIITSL